MKKKILLLEDDDNDIARVKYALEKIGSDAELIIVNNGADGLAKLTGVPNGYKLIPDIILLDINMPKMNGIEFLRIIKNYYSLKDIKTFILTRSAENYNKLVSENLEVDGYILKPLDFNDLNSESISKLFNELSNN